MVLIQLTNDYHKTTIMYDMHHVHMGKHEIVD